MTAAATLVGRPSQPPPVGAPPVGAFEFWPGWLFYLPVVLQWIALGLRHGDFSLPTAANPTIETGGLCGESKASILDMVGPTQRDLLAPYIRLPRPDPALADDAMKRAGIGFPVVAKPDIGCNGTGVRLVRDRAALLGYLAAFQADTALLLQRYVPAPGEAGIFYIRRPDEAAGRVTSLTLKFPPMVVGDGRSTIRELVLADPRMGRVPHLYLPRLGAFQHEVLAPGAEFQPVFVGNHCKGSVFRDGRDHITPALTARIAALADAIPEFHFGRIDVRYDTLARLRRGEGFTVIEINGVGSEATHVWDASTPLLRAWADELAHFGAAFEIGAANRARGHRTSGLADMFRAWRRQQALMAAYPAHD